MQEAISNTKIHLEKKFIDELIAHARKDDPDECCGIIAGKDGKVLKLYPTTNEEKSPVRYKIPPQELFNAIKDIESRGWDLIGMYHSHTHSEAYPSPTDVRMAFWPESLYFIVSLSPPAPRIRAFNIVESKISEIEIKLIPD